MSSGVTMSLLQSAARWRAPTIAQIKSIVAHRFGDSELDKLDMRRQDFMLGRGMSNSFVTVLLMGICTFAMLDTPKFTSMLVWMGVLCAYLALDYVFLFKPVQERRRAGLPIKNFDHTLFHLSTFITVAICSAGGYLFLPTMDDPERFVIVATIFGGYLCGSVQSFTWMSIQLPLLFIYTTIVGLMLRFIDYGYYLIATIFMMYVVYITFYIRNLTKLQRHHFEIELENENLLSYATEEREKANVANQEKSRFLSAASHDLRQPLNSLGLFIYSLKQKLNAGSGDWQEPLEGIEKSHQSLKSLFSSLMEVSRFDEGSIAADRKPVDVDQILSPLVSELSAVAAKKNLELHYTPSVDIVDSDPALLTRIFRNLIDNAIKYTQQGSIDISHAIDGDDFCITISDTGIGIEEVEIEHIFDEYRQVDNKARNKSEGLGLGLAIVKKSCELLGHAISVESRPNVGTVFTVRLPLTEENPELDSPANAQLPTLFGTVVLVVDDDQEILRSTNIILEDWGCEVLLADGLDQARKQIAVTQPEVILSDFMLDDHYDGVDLLNTLTAELPAGVIGIIMSGDSSPETQKKARENGYIHLTKPVEPDVLHEIISLEPD